MAKSNLTGSQYSVSGYKNLNKQKKKKDDEKKQTGTQKSSQSSSAAKSGGGGRGTDQQRYRNNGSQYSLNRTSGAQGSAVQSYRERTNPNNTQQNQTRRNQQYQQQKKAEQSRRTQEQLNRMSDRATMKNVTNDRRVGSALANAATGAYLGRSDDAVAKTVRGSAKEWAGGQLKNIGYNATHQSAYQNYKDSLDHQLQTGKITKSEYDDQLKQLQGSKAYEYYQKDKQSDSYKARQGVSRAGESLSDQGTKEIEEAKEGKSRAEQWALGALSSGVGMGLDRLTGPLWAASMYGRSTGSALGEAKAQGASEIQDVWNAQASGGIEAASEYMFQGIGLPAKLTGGKSLLPSSGRFIDWAMKSAGGGKKAGLINAGLKLAAGIGEEEMEEIAAWGVQPAISNMIYGNQLQAQKDNEIRGLMQQYRDGVQQQFANMSPDEANYMISQMSTGDYQDGIKQTLMENEMPAEQADAVSKLMAEYAQATMTGDTERAQELEDEIVRMMSPQVRKTWDTEELLDTIMSTAIMVGATGTPGTINTARFGAEYKANLGAEGVRKMVENGLNFEDADSAARAQSMLERIDSGKELTNTQVADLAELTYEQYQTDYKRQQSSEDVISNRLEEQNLIPAAQMDTDGNYRYGEVTAKAVEADVNAVQDIVDNLSIEEPDQTSERAAEAVAAWKNAGFTVKDADEIVSNPVAKTAFEQYTGNSLRVFNVYNRDGSLNQAKTNAKIKDFLFATAAENAVQSAEAETANWRDNVKGRVIQQAQRSVSGSGINAMQDVLDQYDERDPVTYMTAVNAASMMYQAGKSMGTEWENVRDEAVALFRNVDESALRSMYQAGVEDRLANEDKARGMDVKIGEKVTEMEDSGRKGKGEVIVQDGLEVKGTTFRVFSELAQNLGINIHLVDHYVDRDGKKRTDFNGFRDEKTGDIYLNINGDPRRNIGYIFMHEVTHHLRQYAPKEYQALANAVREHWFKVDPQGMQARIRQIQELYSAYDSTQQLTDDEALEEIIADAAHEFLLDENFAREVSETDPTIAKSIINGIRKALRVLRRMFATTRADDPMYRQALFSQLDMLDEAEHLWMQAYQAAVRNKAAVGLVEWDRQNQMSIGEGGYYGRSMSNRAIRAYAQGEQPISKWTKEAITDEVNDINDAIDLSKLSLKEMQDNFLTRTSWHHTGAFYNNTDFYSIDESAVANMTQEDVDDIINSRTRKTKSQEQREADKRNREVVNQAKDVASKLNIIYQSGVTGLKSFGGIIKRWENGKLDIDSNDSKYYQSDYQYALSKIREQDSSKVNQWRSLPKDHPRQGTVSAFDNDIESYARSKFEAPSVHSKEFKRIKEVIEQKRNATEDFSSKYDLSNVPEENYVALAEELKNLSEDYSGFGIRWLEPEYAAALKHSYRWDDNTKTNEELDGISAIEIGRSSGYFVYSKKPQEIANEIKNILNREDARSLGGRKPFIVYNEDGGYGGEDIGEIILNDAKILDVSKYMSDVRFSITEEQRTELNDAGVDVTEGGSAVRYSLNSWNETDKEALLKKLIAAGYEEEAASKWLDDVNSVAARILGDMDRLDYYADPFQPALKPNAEYYYTLDLSTLCAKRRLYQGTYNAIMHQLVDIALQPQDTIRLRQLMNELGYEVPCGICYEESRKKNEGKFAERWLNGYGKKWKGYKNQEHEDPYIPTLDDVTTTDRREGWLRENHPEAYESYINYQKTRGSANPKVSFTHTDYRGDILNLTDSEIEKIMHIGGLRIQSFSDFETVHVIDMMQAVMDMAAKGLKAQAYTKVPAFADIFGGTGIKINLSLIGKWNPETQQLEFDAKEGIDPDEAFRLREKYPDNVGTILVGADDASILAAWADPRIDMVIPFHRSGWSKKEFDALGLQGYKDYTKGQTERYLMNGKDMALSTASKALGLTGNDKLQGIYSEDYWEKDRSGKENAEAYLKLCAEKHYRPAFYQFLQDNKNGTWSLKEDGSTDGYWKCLIDFKMYNNDGKGVEQKKVEPNFDMDAAQRTMDAYEGGADTLPVAQDVVNQFVAEKKGTRFSISPQMDADYMSAVEAGDMEEAQRLVDEAAKKAGYIPEHLYHGTMEGGFTVFESGEGRGGIFTTNNPDVAATYSNNGEAPFRSDMFDVYNYLDIEDPGKRKETVLKYHREINGQEWVFDHEESGHEIYRNQHGTERTYDDLASQVEEYGRAVSYNMYRKKGRYKTIDFKGKRWDRSIDKSKQPRGLAEKARSQGYDGLTIKNIIDPRIGYDPDYLSNITMVFDPSHLKSAEAVSYREDGSVIPLSERFNPANSDIRYSLPSNATSVHKVTSDEIKRIQKKKRTNNKDREILRDAGMKLSENDFYQLYSAIKVKKPEIGTIHAGTPVNTFASSNSDIQRMDVDEYRRKLKSIDMSDDFIDEQIEKLRKNPGDGAWVGDIYYPYIGSFAKSIHWDSGDVLVLVPNHFLNSRFDKMKYDFRPFDYEVVTVEQEYQPFYELYSKAYDEATSLENTEQESELDTNGRELSDKQVDYFKRSKARDESGRLVPVYHTTSKNGGFTVFDPMKSDDHRSLFFADSFVTSQTYAKNANQKFEFNENDTSRGYYEVYLNLENPLIVDAQGAEWYQIPYGPGIEGLMEHTAELEKRCDLMVKNIYITHGAFNDDSEPTVIDIGIDYRRKNENGEWSDIQTFEKSADIGDVEYEDASEMSSDLWAEAEKILIDFGLPQDYIGDLENDHADFDGDIIRELAEDGKGGIDYDYINTQDGFYEILDEDEWMDSVSTYDTRELSEMAEDMDHDGVIIKNCIDLGGVSGPKRDVLSNIYIAFRPEQIKDVDNLNPTSDPDIRWSIPTDDEMVAYRNINNKDMESIPLSDPISEEGRVRMAKSKEDFFNDKRSKWNDRWLTEGQVLKRQPAEKNIREMVKRLMSESETNRQYKSDMVQMATDTAMDSYRLLKNGDRDMAYSKLWECAYNMCEGVDFFHEDPNFEAWKKAVKFFKKSDNIISTALFNINGMTRSEFAKKNAGRFRLVSSQEKNHPITAQWGAIQLQCPGLIENPESITTEEEMLIALDAAFDRLTPYREAYTSEEATALVWQIADELYNIVTEGEAYQSVADIYTQRIKDMKQRHQEALRRVKENAKISKESALNRQKEKHQRTVKRIRENANISKDMAVAREKKKLKDYKIKQRDNKSRLKSFKSIRKNYNWLVDRLLNETDKKHIPEEFRIPLATMLADFDLQTERSKQREALLSLIERNPNPAKNTVRMRAVTAALREIASEDGSKFYDESTKRYFNDDISLYDRMDELAKHIEDRSIDSLTVDDMRTVDDMLAYIRKGISDYGKIIGDEQRRTVAEFGENTVEYLDKRFKENKMRKTYTGAVGFLQHLLNEGMTTPIYFFERIDPNGTGIGAMYKQLRRGEDQYIKDVAYIKKQFKDITGKYYKFKKPGSELTSWRDGSETKEFQCAGGPITLTPAQIMSVYCLSQRQQALNHMTGGGIVVAPVTSGQKLSDQFKGKHEQTKPVVLSEADIMTIRAALSPEQKEIADKFMKLLNGKMSEWGNEVSMEMYGYQKFREKTYFPIKSSDEVLLSDVNKINVHEKIKNMGMTKALVKDANNAIVVDDIFHVVADHCNKMALYHSMTIPITNFMRVYNYKRTHDENGNRIDVGNQVTVQQMIGNVFTRKANGYIMKFMDDINQNTQSRSDAVEDLLKKSLANYKKAAIGANIRVALQQPTAIVRAYAVLDPKYFAGAKPSLKAIREMKEHCPIALWKTWGHYEMDLGHDMEDILMNEDWSRWDLISMGSYGALDNMTWGIIWQAVKKEVQAKHPGVQEGSDEFWTLCNERASEVYDKTQVVDSLFHRSDTMRNKNIAVKMMVSFKAEPTLTYNCVKDGLIRFHDMMQDGDKAGALKVLSRVTTVYIVNAALTSAAAAVADMLRGKGSDDDDKKEMMVEKWLLALLGVDDPWTKEEKTHGDLYLMNFLNNFFGDNANILNNIYFVSDIKSFAEGWSSSNMALEGWELVGKSIHQFTQKAFHGGCQKTSYQKIALNFVYGLGYVTGVPTKTVGNDIVLPLINKVHGKVFAGDELSLLLEDTKETTESKLEESGKKESASTTGTTASTTGTTESSTKKKKSSTEVEETVEEEKPIDYEKLQAKAIEKAESAPKSQKNEKIWDTVSDGYTKHLEAGDWTHINKIREIYTTAGGDPAVFDKKITDQCKSSYKKTINNEWTIGDLRKQQEMKDYMEDHGVTDAEISDMCYHSYSAKDLKAAMRIGDQNLIMEELLPLVMAGLSYDDFCKLYENRNRGAKTYTGKYSDPKYTGSTGTYKWPASGPITSGYGYRDAPTAGASSNHQGIDIGASFGDPVQAADGGTVTFVGYDGAAGNRVIIRHADGTETLYSHLSGFSVQVGDKVAQGQQVGQVGSTGVSTGPHLDFRVRVNGSFVNPMEYLAS